jgi:hypothetical protein
MGRLLDVGVLREERRGMSDHLLVEGRLRLEQRCMGNKFSRRKRGCESEGTECVKQS